MEDLRQTLATTWRNLDTAAETTLVTNTRHLEALQNAATALRRVRDGLGSVPVPTALSPASVPEPTALGPASVPTDLLAQDLREALYHLGTIVGEVSTDEILGNIFRNFCIGK